MVSKKLGIVSIAVGTGDVPPEKLEAARPDYDPLKSIREAEAVILNKNRTHQRKVRL